MSRIITIVCLALTLASEVCAAEKQGLTILELHHRPAQEIVPLLQPFLAPGGVIQAADSRLIVRTTPANLQQLQSILIAVDRAPRRLLITVRQDRESADTAHNTEASGTISTGGSQAQVRVYRTESRDQSALTQTLQVLEGRPAHIHAGLSLPVQQQRIDPSNGSVEQETVYIDATTGFDVFPTVMPDGQVKLEIAPHASNVTDTPRAGTIERRTLNTTVYGKLGQWLELGGSTSRMEEQGSGILRRTGERGAGAGRVLVKVTELP